MRLGSRVGRTTLDLATAIHIVKLVSHVGVLAFTAIDLVSLFGDRESINAGRDRVNEIVAIPAVDDILTRAANQRLVVAVAPVEHVIAPIKVGQIVLSWPAMEHVFAAFIRITPKSAALQQVVAIPAVDDVAA